jgi:crotonobetainyl-CoA:carnitine CoA-transferase CaiB-like acyl-CoA transferase
VLSDYRVLDLTDERGALCGQLLADLGAQVVRIEPPGGSSMRHARRDGLVWDVYARNCASLVIDLATATGRDHFKRLATDVDLLIAPGSDVAGTPFPELQASNPGIVWVSITPFGCSGPKCNYQATDLIVQAASGTMAITGFHDSRPLRTGAITAWSHAGVAAAGGALLALRSRDRTGRGQLVDISAQSACNLAASFSLLTPHIGASRIGRAGNIGGVAIPLIWPANDGFVSMTLAFAGPMIGFANNLLRWMTSEGALPAALAELDWPTYMGSLRGGGDRAPLNELNAHIARFLAARSKAQLLDGALRHGALLVPVATTHDLLQSPQLAERHFWWDSGGVTLPGAFARFSTQPVTLRRRAPALGAHPEPLFRPRATTLAPAGEIASTKALPLDGINVLDFSWVMAGPWSTRVLADFGATVVKVESRTRLDLVRILGPFYGDKMSAETSASFASINAGKFSLEVDPGTPDGKATILALVDWADIVVESFSPKAMKKWGLDYAALKERKPSLIMLSTCLFGQTGPYAMMAGYGTMGAALGGLTLPTGEPGRPPCGPFGPYTDYVAPRFSVLAMLAALHHRDKTGEGQYIDQAQAESAMHYLSLAVAAASVGDDDPDRLANTDPDMCPHDVFACAGDDQWLAIAVRDDADWRALTQVLEIDALRDTRFDSVAGRRSAETEINAQIARWTASRDAADIETRLQKAGVPAHVVTNGGTTPDPQLMHRGHFVRTHHHQLGDVWIESVGYVFSDMTPRIGKVPSLGGDSERVRREILGESLS